MKKSLKLFTLIAILSITFILTGCKSYKTVKFDGINSEKINITLNTTDGYDISAELPFYVTKNAKKICQGEFITIDSYDQALIDLKSTSGVKIIDKGSRDEGDYIFYSYDDSSFEYILKLKKSNTTIHLTSNDKKDDITTCAKLLKFEKID